MFCVNSEKGIILTCVKVRKMFTNEVKLALEFSFSCHRKMKEGGRERGREGNTKIMSFRVYMHMLFYQMPLCCFL
jgi:hypothetical protein